MPDTPTSPMERLLRALVKRERVANSLAVGAVQREQEAIQEIARILQRIDPTAPGPTRFRRQRTDKVLTEAQKVLREHAPAMERFLKDHLAPIGRAEAIRAQTELAASLGAVGSDVVNRTPITQQRLRAILNTDPFRGKTLREHLQRQSANTLDRVRTQIRVGMTAEEPIGDIVRRVRGRQAGFVRKDPDTGQFVKTGTRGADVRRRFRGGVLAQGTRDVESLVRTAVTYISNVGLLETYKANADIVQWVRFVAVLDDRNTLICLSLDGRRWRADDPSIVVPGDGTHYGCRSDLVPEMDWAALDLDPPPEPDRVIRDLSTVEDEDLLRKVSARRRTGDFGDVTTVPGNIAAEDWFLRQRPAVQNRVVGATRAQAFREGRISSFRDLIRDDFTTIPLDELGIE